MLCPNLLFFAFQCFYVHYIYVHKRAFSYEKIQINKIREHFAKYLTEAEQGEEIVITRHAKPTARLIAYKEEKPKLPDLTEFKISMKVEGKPMSEEVINMRREARY